MSSSARLFTIPATAPFLTTLARAVLDGRILAGWPHPANPLSLTQGTLFLSTRRACRAMRDAFFVANGCKPLLMPRIVPLGDVDEDEWAFATDDPLSAVGIADLPPAVAKHERQIMLAQLIHTWSNSVSRATTGLAEGEAPLIGTSVQDGLLLAGELMQLMDQVQTEGVAWDGLDQVVEADLDRYWSLSRDFLRIVSETWPQILSARGEIDPATRRDLRLRAEAERLKQINRPFIVAGSTGSIRATRALIAQVAQMPLGAVVLAGLDQALDDETWTMIDTAPGSREAGHPQYGLKRLIEACSVDRDAVKPLAVAQDRDRFLSEMMRPALSSDRWRQQVGMVWDAALAGLGVVEAASEQEEALALAVHLRQIAEDPLATAALITPDRTLARRVTAELDRWQVAYDDSGGIPLAETAPVAIARLSARVALDEVNAADLLALVGHPLVDGHGLADRDSALSALEIGALRGIRPRNGLAGVRQRLNGMIGGSHPFDPARRLSDAAIGEARALVDWIDQSLAPLAALRDGTHPLAEFCRVHRACLANLSQTIVAAPGGAELDRIFEALSNGASDRFAIEAQDYGMAFESLLAGEVVRLPGSRGARIRILGLPEARMIEADHLVLGGLNEGIWPMTSGTDPWLSRGMRARMGLEQPERRIGLAAHDLCQFLGTRQVTLSRSLKQGGVPSVPSRWMQRLAALVGAESWAQLKRPGEDLLAAARKLDQPARVQAAARPNPKPALALRPRSLSVTQIETLIRDPYAVYGREILKLQALRPLDEAPGARDYGTIIHGAIADFLQSDAVTATDEERLGRLLAAGRAAFAPFEHDLAVTTIWWPRFERIARWLLAFEAERRPAVARSHVEISGRLTFATERGDFTLRARADRIDAMQDGTLAILDYKTGSPASQDQVRAKFAQQLPLEAAIAQAGGFDGVAPGQPIGALAYIKLGSTEPAGEVHERSHEALSHDDWAREALDGLQALIRAYDNPDQGYLSHNMPQTTTTIGDYDHLARVAEWRDDSGGEA